MKFALTKNEWGHFVPTWDSDKEKANKIRVGETRTYESKKSRNIKHHRKLFALFRLVLHYLPEDKRKKAFEAGFRFKTEHDVLFYVKIKLGYIRNRAVTKQGNIIYEPDSISFENMGQDKFDEFYSKAVDTCIELLDATKELIENELINFM